MNLNSVHLTVQPTSISPAITTQPASQTIDEGQSANYSVVAAGVPTPACQWQRMPAGTGTWTNMTNVSGTYGGTSTPALTVSNATPEMTGDQFRCVANNGILSSATSSAATLTVQLGYTVWETNYFGSQSGNTSISGPSAIPQNDGIPNVIKYLCDINPAMPMTTASRAALPTIGVVTISGTQYGTLTYRQNQATPGLTFSVQTSSDLKAWTTITSYMIHPSGTDSATGDPIQQIQLNTNGGQKMFLRLNAIVQ